MTVNDGDVLRVSARFDGYHDQDIVNVYHFRCDFAAPQADVDVMAGVDTYLTSVYVDFDDDLHAQITPVDLKVDVVVFSGGKWVVSQNVGFSSWGAGINTTGATDPIPPGAAAVAFLQTSLGKHQGRKFFGGFIEAANSPSGAVDNSVQGRILTGVAKLLTPHVISAGNDLITCIVANLDGAVRDIIGTALNGHWGYIRNRRPGVGS